MFQDGTELSCSRCDQLATPLAAGLAPMRGPARCARGVPWLRCSRPLPRCVYAQNKVFRVVTCALISITTSRWRPRRHFTVSPPRARALAYRSSLPVQSTAMACGGAELKTRYWKPVENLKFRRNVCTCFWMVVTEELYCC